MPYRLSKARTEELTLRIFPLLTADEGLAIGSTHTYINRTTIDNAHLIPWHMVDSGKDPISV